MEIDIRCENCGEYLEIEKEWTDRNGINITVNPCDEKEVAQSLADKRLVLLKRIEWRPDEMNDYYCPVCYGEKEEGHNFDCELAEAIAEE